jgi:hypothetical protein
MSENLTRREALATALSLPLLPAIASADKPAAPSANALTLLVTDPLAGPLACPCVKGYAQRDYDKLGKYLEGKLGRPVAVHYSESLAGALKKSDGKADLIIGKDSVVRADGPANKLAVTHLACLTGLDGKTTQTGLVCVVATDPAVTAADLKDHTIYFGLAKAEEKHGAAVKMLKDLGLAVPAKPETCPTCTDGAVKLLEEAKAGRKAATVISSYAHPLLEGCGTLKKGELRVVAETDPVPFVAAFATGSLAAGEQTSAKAALLAVGAVKELCTAIETKAGFVEPEPAKKK